MVELHGILTKHTFPEQPNYESIARGDAPATYFFVTPHTPFCVTGGGTDTEPAAPHVTQVQLVFTGKSDAYKKLRPYLGKTVVCTGVLFSAISGHHHSPVVLSAATCNPSQQSVPTAPSASHSAN
ncbi:MAG: DUF4431 domain-containing protein [Burkholderiaceae bacterium]|nr:DUF4431 domain-containing protein [Burkholderiaceae bacterium]